jgi:hypothetical protein
MRPHENSPIIHPAGHMAIFVGDKWVSNFSQKTIWPYIEYKNIKQFQVRIILLIIYIAVKSNKCIIHDKCYKNI